MKEYRFKAYGHENILATHKNTLEITKDKSLTKNGDCIIGVGCVFDLKKLKDFEGKVQMMLSVGDCIESFEFEVNQGFTSEDELVCRLGNYASERTYGINCSKSSKMLDRKIVEKLQKGETMFVTITQKPVSDI